MSERKTRRLFLRETVGLAAPWLLTRLPLGTVDTATGAIIFASKKAGIGSKKIYRGPVRGYEGMELLDDQELRKMLAALNRSGSDNLRFAAAGIEKLAYSKQKPGEFPDWIGAEMFPMKIVTLVSSESTVEFTLKNDSDPKSRYAFDFLKRGDIRNRPLIESANFALQLGTNRVTKSEGDLPEALYVAKEYYTALVQIGLAHGYYNYIRDGSSARLAELDGSEITDPSRKLEVGMSEFFHQSEKGSELWHLSDKLPMAMVATSLPSLIKTGKLPRETRALPVLYFVADSLVKDQAVDKSVDSFMREWRSIGTLLPPESLASFAFYGQIPAYIRTLRSGLNQRFGPDA